jgi:ribonucleotide reductase alpha subunit
MSTQKIMKGLGNFVGPTESLERIVEACTDYMKVAEEERTKRREIEAWEKTTVTKIKAQRDLLMEFLDRSFDERSENFRQMFDVVDRAIATGNNQQLALTLDAIVLLANSSPFKELASLSAVRAALDDPDHEWTF